MTDTHNQFVVNVSSNVSHWHAHPITLARPSYSFTKNASTMFFQMIAETTPVEKMQVVSYHPGLIWSEIWESIGFKDDTGFDDSKYTQIELGPMY
jgi:NAD(P)-dependent dehydrogenase (short-subunit alcohol dehydrogenase family)